MLLWIIIGIVVVAAGVWAFWPRRRGVVDGDVRRSRRTTQGKVGNYDSGTGFGGSPF